MEGKNRNAVERYHYLQEQWVAELSAKYGKQLQFIKQLKIKNAEDYLLHIVLCDADRKLYLCAMAFNELQEFRLQTSIECIKNMKQVFGDYYYFNEPLWCGKLEKIRARCVLYFYYNNAKRIDQNSNIPVEILDQIYASAEEVEVTEELLARISENILKYCFPRYSYEAVISSRSYKEYIDLLRKMKRVRLVNTHCDYSPSNILEYEGGLVLIDFEQGAIDIPIGYDKLHYMKYRNQVEKEKIPYYELNECLWGIMHITKKELGQEKYKPIFLFDEWKSVDIKEEKKSVRIQLENMLGGGVFINLSDTILEPFTYRKLVEELVLKKKVRYVIVYQSIWDLTGGRRQEQDNSIEIFTKNTFAVMTLSEMLFNKVAEKILVYVTKRKVQQNKTGKGIVDNA